MARKRNEPIIDALPEHYPYRDTGCEVSPSCLRCPLLRCKYDDPGWLQRGLRQRRDEEVLRVRSAKQLTVPQLAERFGLSERTVHRILSRSRTSNGESPEGSVSDQ